MQPRNGQKPVKHSADRVHLLVSVIIPNRSGERHLALFVHDVQGDLFIGSRNAYSRVRSRNESWIWIDWPLAYKFLVAWIRRRYRCTMQRLSCLLHFGVAAPTERSSSTSELAMRPHLGPSTASVRPADTERHH